mgnify:CR=1 FL=1
MRHRHGWNQGKIVCDLMVALNRERKQGSFFAALIWSTIFAFARLLLSMAFLDVAGDMSFTANSALAKYCLELIFCALIILGVNFCAKSKCSHWCLLKPQGYSCHCPIGFQLMDDNITCQGKKPMKCFVLKETVVIRRWGSETRNFGIRRGDKGKNTKRYGSSGWFEL